MWASVFKPGTAMTINGGVPLLVISDDGERLYRVQHPYYPPVECRVPWDAVTALTDAIKFVGCVNDPQCYMRGIRRKDAHRPCTCLGCWAKWWQKRANENDISYPRKGSPQWVTASR
jgi:hypothetical protein